MAPKKVGSPNLVPRLCLGTHSREALPRHTARGLMEIADKG
jgi:hypothetical protein